MDVVLAGAGPAAEAVAAALDDAGAAVTRGGPASLSGADLAVVTGPASDEGFREADEVARESGTPWIAVEGGGLGGHVLADVEASVAGFAPGTACYECLGLRVAANLEEGEADGGDGRDDPAVDGPTARLAGATAGREAARLLGGDESPVLGGVLEIPHAVRRVLPVPNCPACGEPRDRTLDRSYRDRGLEAALAAAEEALDDRVGLVTEVGEVESFPVPYYLARVCDTAGFSDAEVARQAAGVADDWNAAFVKALGEGLERYSAGVYREADFRRSRPGEVAGMVPPGRFVGGEDVAASGGDAGVDEALPWVEATDLSAVDAAGQSTGGTAGRANGDAAWLPAELVQFPPPERRFGPAITTGLGLGNSGVEAVLSGLYEVLERDATMLAWYSTFEPLGLAVDDEGYRTLARRARSEGLATTALLVTQDVDVPVVATAVHREEEWPRFAVGSDADLDPAAAARSALAEALQNWTELRGMGPEDAADEAGAIGRHADLPAAAREFVDPDTTVPADSVGPADLPEGEAELDAGVDRVIDAGLTPYAARITPRDVESLGFEAVRVVVPGAQPLFTGEPRFADRAREVPGRLGFEPRLDREMHPYP